MEDVVEVLPLVEDVVVLLEVQIGLAVFCGAFRHHAADGVDHHKADAAVGGQHADEGKVDDLGLSDRLQDAEEGGEGHPAARLLQRLGDGGEAQPEADGPFVLVEDHGDIADVDDLAEALDELFFHVLGEGHGAVDLGIRLVEDAEEVVLIEADEFVCRLRFAQMHLVALHDLVAQFGKALVGLLRGIELVLHPVDVLLIP